MDSSIAPPDQRTAFMDPASYAGNGALFPAQPILTGARSWPLHGLEGSRRVEAQVLARWPGHSLMAWAGTRVARWIIALAPHAQRIWVAAGPGGNGGDGLYAAAHLAQAGRAVEISLHGPTRPEALEGLQRALACGARLRNDRAENTPDLVIDALLGLGASRPLDAPMTQAVRDILTTERPCLSIDLPTGLNGNTGQPLGPVMVKAHATLSLLTLKPGLLMGEGRDAAGQIWLDVLDSLALADTHRPLALTTLQPKSSSAPTWRAHASHKGSYGDVVVVGGTTGMSGALHLAAHAALGAGAGRVLAVPLDPGAAFHDVLRPECMWLRPQDLDQHPLERATVVCGCGGGEAVRGILPALLARANRVVLDADALNAVAALPSLADAVKARAGRGQFTILTPHPLEAARLLQQDVRAIQASRLEAARTLAAQHHATVVLKGSGTVIASPGEVPQVNVTGNGALAAGGTGDVLAGWLGGRWACRSSAQPTTASARVSNQHTPHTAPWSEPQQVACEAVFTHGRAADRLPPVNAVRALDLVDRMRDLLLEGSQQPGVSGTAA